MLEMIKTADIIEHPTNQILKDKKYQLQHTLTNNAQNILKNMSTILQHLYINIINKDNIAAKQKKKSLTL